MGVERLEAGGMLTLGVRGTFDGAAAERLCAALDDAGAERPIRIDLRRVQCFHDSAVVHLARALLAGGRSCPVALVGLYEHHARLLRYMGLGAVLGADAGAGAQTP